VLRGLPPLTLETGPSQGAGGGGHTQMTWNTTDIEAEVVALKARGVIFEEYDTSGLKTVNGGATIARSKRA
jgi:hypothetical protein